MNLMKHQIMLILAIITIIISMDYIHGSGLIEVFQWKQIDFYNRGEITGALNAGHNPIVTGRPFVTKPGAIIFPDQLPYRRNRRHTPRITSRDQPINLNTRINIDEIDANATASYIPYNNVPMGVTHFNGRLFITMPRRRTGIPSTLNYIDMQKEANNPSPKLRAYPNFQTNYLNPSFQPNSNALISVYRTTVDQCKRLWFIDTGMLEYPGNRTQIQRPSIWVMDLLSDRVIRRFEIPSEIVATGEGLASITIDVSSDNCERAFAYIPDLVNGQLSVYSFKQNHIWRFEHNYFNFDPLGGDLRIGGQSFRWDDGIFSITLGPYQFDGFRMAFFHAMASTNEFTVSTKVLQNEANSQRSDHGNDFMLIGSRGAGRQSTMHAYDARTDVLFYAEIQQNGVGCWNMKKSFTPANHGMVAQDADRMIYPSDLTIDENGVMWVMTNSMPIYIYSNLNPNLVNYRIWKRKTQDAVKSTICEFI